jgi:hypothetical protein
MTLEQLKEIVTNKIGSIRMQAGQAHNEGRLEDFLRLQAEEKESQLILDKLNS